MSKYTITPWRTPSSLLQVRTQLYSTSDPSSQRTAINRIIAWKLRGNLPHAIESTALLVDAILHHQGSLPSPSNPNPPASAFSVRAVYTAAFTRFVTGFCDIGRSKERLLEPSSMLEIARKIGMPTEFVGLRHEATHEEMPSLKRLVGATEEALGWLWDVYWSRLGEIEGEEEMEEGGLERVREVLKAFRGKRKLALKRKGEGRGEERTAGECVRLVDGMESLVRVFVEERLLVPSKREIGDSLDGAYLIWDCLLKAILAQQKLFLAAFVKILLATIGDASTGQSDADAEKEALCKWLVHTVSRKKSWTGCTTSELEALRKEMVMWCCTNPGYWSHYLGVHLIKAGGSSFANIWEDVLEASRLGDGYVGQPIVDDAESEQASDSESEVQETFRHRSKDIDYGGSGWRRAASAPRVPIGVVR